MILLLFWLPKLKILVLDAQNKELLLLSNKLLLLNKLFWFIEPWFIFAKRFVGFWFGAPNKPV